MSISEMNGKHDTIAERAVDWILQLEDAHEDESIYRDFLTWLEADPAHQEAIRELGFVSGLVGIALSHSEKD